MFIRFWFAALAAMLFCAPAHADGATQVLTVRRPQPKPVVWHSDPLGCGLRVAGPSDMVTIPSTGVDAQGNPTCLWYVHLPNTEELAVSFGAMTGVSNGFRSARVIEADGDEPHRVAPEQAPRTTLRGLQSTIVLEVQGLNGGSGHGLYVVVQPTR